MLIVYDAGTGEVIDNTGINSGWPEGPPDDLALINVPEDDRASVALLRLHDVRDSVLVAQLLTHQHTVVDGEVVVGLLYPAPETEPEKPSTDDRLAALEARLDRAAATAVTGDAAKVRDGLKPS